MKISENGRTMIEMLGVLAIVAVVTVGGLGVVSKAIRAQKKGQVIAEATNLATATKKLACQYSDAYDSKGAYGQFLYKSEAYPKGLTYSSSDKYYTGSLDVKYYINAYKKDGFRYFYIKISGLDDDVCMDVATNDWGRYETTGIIGVAVGSGDFKSFMSSDSGTNTAAVRSNSSTYPMPAATAANNCADDNNTVQLWYAGCSK
ncbi:MAG: hypothetical protein IJ525_01830 [Alphaproteobacteria bacterium]|nr:hypothetical protein [Alphaproteobacteria bacterium]